MDEVVELDPPAQEQQQETEQQEQPQGETPEGSEGGQPGEGAAEEDEVVVTIGEESPPTQEAERAPEWVRELRKTNREKDRQIAALREQVQGLQAKPATAEPLGTEPTLAGCDYDEDKFKADWQAWTKRKQDHDAAEAKKQSDAAAQQQAWNAQLEHYGKLRGDLKVRDFDEAEDAVKQSLSEVQQSIIVAGATNPAIVVYALGKNPKKAQELASIKDPVKFAFAVAKLEETMKVTPRKAATLPEQPVKGTAPVSGTVDSTLARLRADAERSGDMSNVLAYKRQLRERGSK